MEHKNIGDNQKNSMKVHQLTTPAHQTRKSDKRQQEALQGNNARQTSRPKHNNGEETPTSQLGATQEPGQTHRPKRNTHNEKNDHTQKKRKPTTSNNKSTPENIFRQQTRTRLGTRPKEISAPTKKKTTRRGGRLHI